ncbi:MAG TPA: extracellular solute-binding protein, partial [Burkholderiaceae bacterium]|nr:extracellular solute-binding protein [Burkholderiaceae bacterium]
PYSAKTGHRILVEDYSGGLAQIRAQVKSNKVTWDVVDLELQDAIRACDEGLLAPIQARDLQGVPGVASVVDDFLPNSLTPCSVGTVMWANVITFNLNKFVGSEPSTVGDFFDLKKFPGKRGMKKAAKANLEWALMADGVAPADVYKVLGTPAGLDRAFRKLNTIKSSIVWWEAGAQPPQLLADGAVTMTSAYSGRIQAAIDVDRKPFKIIWQGQIPEYETLAILKGSKNEATARDFIKFASSPAVLAEQTKYIAYGPLRKSALSLIESSVVSKLPSAAANIAVGVPSNPEWWANNGDEINQRFSVWLAN